MEELAKLPTTAPGRLDTPIEAMVRAKQDFRYEAELLRRETEKRWTGFVQFMDRDRRLERFEELAKTQLRNGIIKQSRYDARKIEVEAQPDHWRVVIRSTGTIPSYACEGAYFREGAPVVTGESAPCRYLK